MKVAWAILYVMGSIWLVGMVMSAVGTPFGKYALLGPGGSQVAVVAPPAQPAAAAASVAAAVAPAARSQPAAESQAAAPATGAQTTTTAASAAPAAQHQATSHAAVATTSVMGSQRLAPRIDGDVKVFDLEASVIKWEALPGQFVEAWAYNGQVPGPLLRISEGDKIRVNLKNSLPEPTVMHFHGPILPNEMDGVPDVTQKVIEPGQSFTYEFTANPPGTFVYHTHHNSAVQEPKGLYGVLIIDPKESGGLTYLGDPKEGRARNYDREYLQVVGELGGYFTINGKAFPATEPMTAKVGERVLIRLVNLGQASHPMHLHGHHFAIVGTDGYPVQGSPLIKDTINVSPGERYDLEILARNPGTWVFHCHILSHVANQGKEPGGMISVLKIEP